MRVPDDLAGNLNLVFVAFLMRQQRDVDTWLEQLGDIEARAQGLAVYEVPVMRRYPQLVRDWADNGMRSGIRDPETRSHTVTVYTDRARFLKQAGLENVSQILVTLLDSNGLVLWSHEGPPTRTSMSGLEKVLKKSLLPEPPQAADRGDTDDPSTARC